MVLTVNNALDTLDVASCSSMGWEMTNTTNNLDFFQNCCSKNIVVRTTGQFCCNTQCCPNGSEKNEKGECNNCPKDEKEASDGKCCKQQKYGWDENGKTFCCKGDEVAWTQDFTTGDGAWTCCDPQKVGTTGGKCCTEDRWIWQASGKVGCC